MALAAWIGEKLTRWSSTRADGQPAFDRDRLLSTLTLYWATRTAASSLLPYWAHRHTPASALPPDDPAPTPTTVDIFGGEIVPFPKPPRELAERYFNVVAWAEHDRGGHFPAVAEPRLLADRLRAAFRPYRQPPRLDTLPPWARTRDVLLRRSGAVLVTKAAGTKQRRPPQPTHLWGPGSSSSG